MLVEYPCCYTNRRKIIKFNVQFDVKSISNRTISVFHKNTFFQKKIRAYLVTPRAKTPATKAGQDADNYSQVRHKQSDEVGAQSCKGGRGFGVALVEEEGDFEG